MRTIWKFEVPLELVSEVMMPVGARVVHAGCQDSVFGQGVHVWALVDPEAPREGRRGAGVPTGVLVSDVAEWIYVNAVELPNGIMLHVFDGGPGTGG